MTQPIRIFIASNGDPAALARGFEAEFPDAEVFASLDQITGGDVPYVVAGKPDAGIISSVPGAQLLLSLNAGVEHLLKEGEVPDGIPIVRLVDPAMTEGMSDWVLAVTLSWHRNLAIYRGDPEWTRRQEKLSRDRVVTVLGAGTLGSRVARLLAGIGFRTRVWSRTGRDVPPAISYGGPDGLIAATTNADVVVNLLPLTQETEGVLDAALFNRMTRGGFVANAGRGAHVIDADLIAALDSGQLSAAALDVFRKEPLPVENSLWQHPDVLVTPHVAAPTQAGSAVRIMAESIRQHLVGETPDNLVDRGRGY